MDIVESSKRSLASSLPNSEIFTNLEKSYEAYQKDIAYLSVYFDTPTVMEFRLIDFDYNLYRKLACSV